MYNICDCKVFRVAPGFIDHFICSVCETCKEHDTEEYGYCIVCGKDETVIQKEKVKVVLKPKKVEKVSNTITLDPTHIAHGKLKKYNQYLGRKTDEKQKQRTFARLDFFCEQLGIGKVVRDQTLCSFQRVTKGHFRSNHKGPLRDAMILVCIHNTLRSLCLDIPLHQLLRYKWVKKTHMTRAFREYYRLTTEPLMTANESRLICLYCESIGWYDAWQDVLRIKTFVHNETGYILMGLKSIYGGTLVFLARRYKRQLDIDEVADVCGISLSTIERVCKMLVKHGDLISRKCHLQV